MGLAHRGAEGAAGGGLDGAEVVAEDGAEGFELLGESSAQGLRTIQVTVSEQGGVVSEPA